MNSSSKSSRPDGSAALRELLLEAWNDVVVADETELSEADIELLAIHAEGRTTDAERERAELLLEQSPRAQQTFQTMWASTQVRESSQTTSGPKAEQPLASSARDHAPRRQSSAMLSWAATAAALFIAVTVGFWGLQTRQRLQQSESQIAELQQRVAEPTQQLLSARKEQLYMVANQRTLFFTGESSPQMVSLAMRRLDSDTIARGTTDMRDLNDAKVGANAAAKLTESVPADAPLKLERIALLIAASEFSAAEKELSETQKTIGTTSAWAYARATLLLSQAYAGPVEEFAEKAHAAENLLRDLIQRDPTFAPALFTLAQFLETHPQPRPSRPGRVPQVLGTVLEAHRTETTGSDTADSSPCGQSQAATRIAVTKNGQASVVWLRSP